MAFSIHTWAAFGCLLLFCCTASEQATKERIQAQERYKTLATEKYKDNIAYFFNESKTHVLCIKQPKPSNEVPQQRVSFFVYDNTANEIVFEDEISNGAVTWKNNHQIQVHLVPGVIEYDDSADSSGYLFDLRLRKKIDLRANELQKPQ